MIKYQKVLNAWICFLFFLSVGFFCLSVSSASAIVLEVQYPKIPGATALGGTEVKLPDYVLYLFNAGMSIGIAAVFISLVIAGMMYFLSPAKPDLLADAKDRVGGAISGLLILVLTYLIITTINPQLNVFTFNKLPAVELPAVTTSAPGVYFYSDASDCPNNPAQINTTSSVADLGTFKNSINSVNIVHDIANQTSYISILYANPNFWGKCQYIDPNSSCSAVDHFASSASVHVYDPAPNRDGVYFYRKPCFNKIGSQFNDVNSLVNYCNSNSGGYLKVSNSEIKNAGSDTMYVGDLNQLKFTGVPDEEQDCVKYDDNGQCTGRKPPSLGGENISSIIINGNYLVLFVYFAPGDTEAGPWNSCQEFPGSSDVNRIGPQQIKWEDIRANAVMGASNGGGKNTISGIPNYVIIIPIQGG